MYYVYILLCKNKAFYTGITNDRKHRLAEHKEGKGAHYTKVFGVQKLVYSEKVKNRSAALKREFAIKGLSRKAKRALVRGK